MFFIRNKKESAALRRGISHRCPTGAHGAPSVDNRYSRSVKKKAAGAFFGVCTAFGPEEEIRWRKKLR